MDSTNNFTDKSILKKIWRQLIYIVSCLALCWLVAVFCIFFFQRHLQYFPDGKKIGNPAYLKEDIKIRGMKSVSFRTRDGILLKNWYIPPKSKNYPVVVFFHGNAGNISHRVNKARFFTNYGIGVLLVEYRGFGGNRGTPTEGGLYSDGRAAIDFLMRREQTPINKIIIYGESLGTGVATQMAVEYEEAALILEAPFRSITILAKARYPWVPVDALLWDKYESIKKIKHINSAVMILHGKLDDVVPYTEGKYLYYIAKEPKEMVSVDEAGHRNLYEYTQTGRSIIGFLRGQRLLPNKK